MKQNILALVVFYAFVSTIFGTLVIYEFHTMLNESEARNKKLVTKLAKYEDVLAQMDEQGWSPQLVDKFVQEGCVPFFEVGGK